MANKFTFTIYITILFILVTACEQINPEIEVPSYIEVSEFKLSHENALGISDVWVYVDGNFRGVYELPAKFPLIANGLSSVKISPGIRVNGISSTRSYYPFYESYEKTIELLPAESIVIKPNTTYYNWTTVIWSENFENGHQFEKRSISDTVFEISTQNHFSGLSAGAIFMDSTHSFFESYTPELSRPNLSGSPGMFIELNYKCNNPFEIGIYAFYKQQIDESNIILVNATSDWKKIYIDLYNPLLKYPEGTKYKIYIAAFHNIAQMNSSIYIDDFKVVQSSEK